MDEANGEKLAVALKKIPNLKLNLFSIMMNAENIKEAKTFDSDISGVGYVATKEEMIVVTTKGGYLRIDKDSIEPMLFEMENVLENMKRWKRL